MKYKNKPKIIEATQWFPGTIVPGVSNNWSGHFVTTIHNQRVYLEPGDWVVTEPDGIHYYPIKPEIFTNSYEPIDQE